MWLYGDAMYLYGATMYLYGNTSKSINLYISNIYPFFKFL